MSNYLPTKLLSPSHVAVRLVMQYEGCALSIYRDIAGDWTIGYGHKMLVDIPWKITQDEADEMLSEDLSKAATALRSQVTVPLTQNMFDALSDFVFNLGADAFRNSTLRRKLNNGDYEGAAAEFLNWDHVSGIVVEGLMRRREAEAALFAADELRP